MSYLNNNFQPESLHEKLQHVRNIELELYNIKFTWYLMSTIILYCLGNTTNYIFDCFSTWNFPFNCFDCLTFMRNSFCFIQFDSMKNVFPFCSIELNFGKEIHFRFLAFLFLKHFTCNFKCGVFKWAVY